MEILERYTLFDSVLPTTTGIYRIFNLITGEYYIGSAKAYGNAPSRNGFRVRFYGHRRELIKGIHHSNYLQNSYNYYVKEKGYPHQEVFEIQIVEYVEPCDCIKTEDFYIKKYKPRYNSAPQAGGGCGYEWTPERRRIRSELYKGKHLHTPESRAKMSKIQKEIWSCPNRRSHLSQMRKGNTHGKGNKGRKNTPEQSAHQSEVQSNFYVAVSPTGEFIRFRNARKFVEDNPEWRFSFSKICETARGIHPHHKGWKFFPGDYNLTEKDMVPEFFIKSYIGITPSGDIVQFDKTVAFLSQYPIFNQRGISYCLSGEKEFHKGWQFHHTYLCPLTPRPNNTWDRLPQEL